MAAAWIVVLTACRLGRRLPRRLGPLLRHRLRCRRPDFGRRGGTRHFPRYFRLTLHRLRHAFPLHRAFHALEIAGLTALLWRSHGRLGLTWLTPHFRRRHFATHGGRCWRCFKRTATWLSTWRHIRRTAENFATWLAYRLTAGFRCHRASLLSRHFATHRRRHGCSLGRTPTRIAIHSPLAWPAETLTARFWHWLTAGLRYRLMPLQRRRLAPHRRRGWRALDWPAPVFKLLTKLWRAPQNLGAGLDPAAIDGLRRRRAEDRAILIKWRRLVTGHPSFRATLPRRIEITTRLSILKTA